MSIASSPTHPDELAPGAETAAPPAAARSGWRRLLLGDADRPPWARPALLALLIATAVLYLWGLTASGYANSFYAAAVQAATKSWKAWLFGSVDSGNAITVDKPPASLWVMGLSARLFGFSSFSLLLPQVLAGVASVALVHAAVRRWSGPAAGLIAGAALAVTPVAVLMFKYDNPDALLVLLLCAAAYATVRATEKASPAWLALAGVALGFGFLTKMLQAFLILPALALVYLVAAPTPLRRRLLHLLTAGLALVASAGWYVALVELWPASSRPYIGGSTDNSLLQLALGYNGLSRLSGNEFGGGGGMAGFGGSEPPEGLELPQGMELPQGGGPGGGGFGGSTGLERLFGNFFGSQVSWFLPAALVGLVALLWFTRRAPRTDHTRAALLLWGGWLVVTAGVFSYMQGTVHQYYSVALAPAIAALLGISAVHLWRHRAQRASRLTLALLVAVSGGWAYVLLDRSPDWHPELRWAALVLSLLTALGIAAGRRMSAQLGAVTAALALVGAGLGTTAYAVGTTARSYSGAIPIAGPAGIDTNPFGGAGMFPASGEGASAESGGLPTSGGMPFGGQPPSGGQLPPGGDLPGGGSGAGGPSAEGDQGTAGTGMPMGMGGETLDPDSRLARMLESTATRWAAATLGSSSAAALELGSHGAPVMGIGGFTNSDPFPTLAQFRQYVRQGDIHYFVTTGQGQGTGGPGGGVGTGGQISDWVAAHYSPTSVDGYTVYDLTQPAT